MNQASPKHAFRDMSELVGGVAAIDTLENISVPVPAPDVLSVGPPCKDFTGKNNKQKDMAQCVEENVGVSGTAIHHIKTFLQDHRPLLLILEQVAGADRQFSENNATNWEQIMHIIRDQGYVLRSMDLSARNHIPQRRLRKYLAAVHATGYAERQRNVHVHADHRRSLDDCMAECEALVGTIESARLPGNLVFEVPDYLLDETHEIVQAELTSVRDKAVARLRQNPEILRLAKRKVGKKRKASCLLTDDVDEDIESDVDGHLGESRGEADVGGRVAPWITLHEREYAKASLMYSPAHKNPMGEAYRGNPWYEHLTPRYQECILYWDEVSPVQDADPETFLDLHPVVHTQ